MEKDIQKIIKFIQKEVKNSNIGIASDEKYCIDRMPVNIPSLDFILGGGLPYGRTVEIFGDFSAGKTFLSQVMMKEAQEKGLQVAFIDVEKTFDPKWFSISGVNLDNLILAQPVSGEEALDTVINLIDAEVPLVVLDSIAALVPTRMIEEDMEKKFIGVQARLYNDGLKRITAANKHNKSIFLALNQIRAGIGGYFPTDVLPAGKGQYFFSHIMLKVSRGSVIKEGDKKIGFNMKVFVEKNKTAGTMFKSCVLPFLFSGVIDSYIGVLELALDCKIVTQKGPYFHYGENKFLGKKGILDFFHENDDIYNKIKDVVLNQDGE